MPCALLRVARTLPLDMVVEIVLVTNHKKEFVVRTSQRFTKTGSSEVWQRRGLSCSPSLTSIVDGLLSIAYKIQERPICCRVA